MRNRRLKRAEGSRKEQQGARGAKIKNNNGQFNIWISNVSRLY